MCQSLGLVGRGKNGKRLTPCLQGAISPVMEGGYDRSLWKPTQSKKGLAQKPPGRKCHWNLVCESR